MGTLAPLTGESGACSPETGGLQKQTSMSTCNFQMRCCPTHNACERSVFVILCATIQWPPRTRVRYISSLSNNNRPPGSHRTAKAGARCSQNRIFFWSRSWLESGIGERERNTPTRMDFGGFGRPENQTKTKFRRKKGLFQDRSVKFFRAREGGPWDCPKMGIPFIQENARTPKRETTGTAI